MIILLRLCECTLSMSRAVSTAIDRVFTKRVWTVLLIPVCCQRTGEHYPQSLQTTKYSPPAVLHTGHPPTR